jgi:hypothetical protein
LADRIIRRGDETTNGRFLPLGHWFFCMTHTIGQAASLYQKAVAWGGERNT